MINMFSWSQYPSNILPYIKSLCFEGVLFRHTILAIHTTHNSTRFTLTCCTHPNLSLKIVFVGYWYSSKFESKDVFDGYWYSSKFESKDVFDGYRYSSKFEYKDVFDGYHLHKWIPGGYQGCFLRFITMLS
jgi:hypothetical protein